MSSSRFSAGARPALRSHLVTAFSLSLGLAAQLHSRTAAAHIELQLPMNRYSDIKAGDNKACPCGSGSTNRRCSRPEEFSDPDRSTDRITTFAPGDTITVRFDEYVGHSGRYRIAFDPDGAELDDFNKVILLDEPDPTGKQGNIGSGSLWEFEVTLPNMTCDNCTLQLIQVMDGNTEDVVLNPVDRGGTYFQCADIRLVEGTPPGGIEPSNPSEHPGVRGRNELAEAQEEAAAAAAAAEMEGRTPERAGMAPDEMASGSPLGSEGSAPAASDGRAVDTVMGSEADAGGGCSLRSEGPRGERRPGGAALGAFSALLLAAGLRARRSSRSERRGRA